MKKIALILTILGGLLLIYSSTLKPYTNQKEYEIKYNLISQEENRSEKFHELRGRYLTHKYETENYAITFLLTGISLLSLFFKGLKKIKTPKSKLSILIYGFLSVITTTIGYIGDLFLEASRGTFPHWADSLGIPLAGVPIIFTTFFIWYLLNSIGLGKNCKVNVELSSFKLDHINYWFAILILINLIIFILILITGYFWFIIPSLLWAHFYFSILLGRREAILEKNII